MAQTERDTSAILTALADNATGDISAEDLRDALVSLNGGYGAMIMTNAMTANLAIDTNPTVLDVFDFVTARSADINTNGVDVELGTSRIRVNATGTYRVDAFTSYMADTDCEIIFQPFVSGVAGNIEGRLTAKAGEPRTDTANAILPLVAGSFVDVRIRTSVGACNLTYYGASFSVQRVG